jgi:hypothetical protein
LAAVADTEDAHDIVLQIEENGLRVVKNAFKVFGPALPAWFERLFTPFAPTYSLESALQPNARALHHNHARYDPYGNMWVNPTSGGPWSGSTPTSNAFTNNRINGASYDAAGNQTVVNGDTLTYDAENRQSAATDGVTHVTQRKWRRLPR